MASNGSRRRACQDRQAGAAWRRTGGCPERGRARPERPGRVRPGPRPGGRRSGLRPDQRAPGARRAGGRGRRPSRASTRGRSAPASPPVPGTRRVRRPRRCPSTRPAWAWPGRNHFPTVSGKAGEPVPIERDAELAQAGRRVLRVLRGARSRAGDRAAGRGVRLAGPRWPGRAGGRRSSSASPGLGVPVASGISSGGCGHAAVAISIPAADAGSGVRGFGEQGRRSGSGAPFGGRRCSRAAPSRLAPTASRRVSWNPAVRPPPWAAARLGKEADYELGGKAA